MKGVAREILRVEVGSTAHETNLPGTDDLDLMAIAVERPENFLTTASPFEQYVYRSAEVREGKGARSQAGDTDLVIYSLRKFARLAAKGNPSILLALYAPIIFTDSWGARLRDSRDLFVSKEAGRRFLGYLVSQKERMLGTRGGLRVTRQELIDAHGYDTKYAMHAIRLGYQGKTLMTSGYIPVPVDHAMKTWVRLLREGKVPFEVAIEKLAEQEEDLRVAIEASPFPENADMAKIDSLLIDIYTEVWKHERLI